MNYIMEIGIWYYIEPTLKASLDCKKCGAVSSGIWDDRLCTERLDCKFAFSICHL